ncbi:MAG: hypothetical protein ACR2LX_05020 [Jatrophihabitans sp.]
MLVDRRMLRRRLLPVVAAIVALGAGLCVVAATPAAAAPPAGGYVAVTPTRLLDTRTGPGTPVPGLSEIALQAAGRAGLPASGISAVVLNVTVASPTSVGYVAAYAYHTATPTASNVNFVRGQTVPNLVVAPVGDGGKVALYNGSHGTVQLIVDVSGYYLAGTPAAQGGFGPIAPTRVLDTRDGTGGSSGAVAGNQSLAFPVTGHGVPADASAVIINVTAVSPSKVGFVTAYADGAKLPSSSNLNLAPGRTVANLVVVPVGTGGKVALYNGSAGGVQLVADVSGYFTNGDPVSSGAFGALSPTRLLDTRDGTGSVGGAVPGASSIAFTVEGRGGVPLHGVSAVVLNVTAVNPAKVGFVTAYADGTPRPGVSNLNLTPGQTGPNLVLAPVGADGKVALYNGSGGNVDLVADVSGYVLDHDLTVPTTSSSHYIRTTSGLGALGAADAQADRIAGGQHLHLLDIGAQTTRSLPGPGVVLSTTDTRLTDAQLVTLLSQYLDGYAQAGGSSATVAIGTNSDGDFSTFTAQAKGTDWATNVVAPLRSHAAAGITVVGADDIESGFAATEAQAQQWENAYLAATSAALIFNGSANGCPVAYGDTVGCDAGWSLADYNSLAGGSNQRIQALPQIYNADQAVQWANIDAVRGGSIVFAGSLSEHAIDASTLTPAQSWAALQHALSTVVPSPSLPFAADLDVA